MFSIIGFLAFIIYTVLIFFVKSYVLLGVCFLVNLFLTMVFDVSFRKMFTALFRILPFILFTGIINVLIGSFELGITISVRLVLVCNITYIFASNMTPRKLQFIIEKLFRSRDIGIIVSISFAFIPIMQKEMESLKFSLISKGFRFSLINVIKKPSVFLLPLVTSIVKKTAEIEQSMISKGYIG